jgi:carboxypeptidase C (cathepsin A)
VNGEPAGQLRQHKNFKFLRVYDAGHMVPMNQPVAALQMLREFANSGDLASEFIQ